MISAVEFLKSSSVKLCHIQLSIYRGPKCSLVYRIQKFVLRITHIVMLRNMKTKKQEILSLRGYHRSSLLFFKVSKFFVFMLNNLTFVLYNYHSRYKAVICLNNISLIFSCAINLVVTFFCITMQKKSLYKYL